jgi:hypothetical protein
MACGRLFSTRLNPRSRRRQPQFSNLASVALNSSSKRLCTILKYRSDCSRRTVVRNELVKLIEVFLVLTEYRLHYRI